MDLGILHQILDLLREIKQEQVEMKKQMSELNLRMDRLEERMDRLEEQRAQDSELLEAINVQVLKLSDSSFRFDRRLTKVEAVS